MALILSGGSKSILPDHIGLADMMKMLDAQREPLQPDMNWRWAVLDIVRDLLTQSQKLVYTNQIFVEETKLRTEQFLRLAFADPPMQAVVLQELWCVEDVVRLRYYYRHFHEYSKMNLLNCKTALASLTQALLAVYRPMVRHFNLQLILQPLTMPAAACRVLVLMASCILQALLHQSYIMCRGGACRFILERRTSSIIVLKIETLLLMQVMRKDEVWGIMSRLASHLGAEIVHHPGLGENDSLEISFCDQAYGIPPRILY